MKISIIIPTHNEEKRIGKTLESYARFFNKNLKQNYEILVILNGCKDNTLKIVKEIAKKYRAIKFKDYEESGKGFAIMQGFKDALRHKTELIGFVDADMATSPEAFYDLVRNIGNYDGIIASRYVRGAIVRPKQPIQRVIASRVFNFLVRVLFLINYRDTQCGAKVFRKELLEKIMPIITTTNWAIDVDILYKSAKLGLRIKEYPTVWRDIGHSTLNLKKASIQMLFAIIRLRILNSKLRKVWWIFKPFSGILWRLAK
jgi:glycosyltransferase involved in cell wall biosynthesis